MSRYQHVHGTSSFYDARDALDLHRGARQCSTELSFAEFTDVSRGCVSGGWVVNAS